MDPKFVPKSISCFFLFAARSVSTVVTSRSVPQTTIDSISVLTDVSITRIIGVHSTVATFYQWSFLANFSLNGNFRLRCIIKIYLIYCYSSTVIFYITKGDDKYFNVVALISQSFKRYDLILPQSLKFSFLWKSNGESRQVGQNITF